MTHQNHPSVPDVRGKKGMIAWGLWDWGSAAFNAVIVTFVFSVYLVDAVGKDVPGPFTASTWLAWALGAGGLFIAVLAPAMGRREDAKGRRKRSLFILTTAVIATMAALFFVKNDYHYLWLGLVLLSVGSVLFELSQVPYFSMLRQVSSPENVGKISGIGWAFGYLGGIILLLVCLFGFIQGTGDTRGLLNVPTADGMNIRLIALLAAGWFAIFALPLFLIIPEVEPQEEDEAAQASFIESYRVLGRDLKRMWREERSTLNFLISSALFRDGLAGVFAFGAILAVKVYGLDDNEVMYFAVAANVVAAAGAILGGFMDDRIGPWNVIVLSLCSMLVVSVVLFIVEGKQMFWIFGLLLCLFVGPAQAAARSYLARITDVGKEGQNFGLYAMTGRAVSFMAPTLFGFFVWVGGNNERWGIIGIAVVILLGLGMLVLTTPSQVRDRAAESL